VDTLRPTLVATGKFPIVARLSCATRFGASPRALAAIAHDLGPATMEELAPYIVE
jgi:hypothetical protein